MSCYSGQVIPSVFCHENGACSSRSSLSYWSTITRGPQLYRVCHLQRRTSKFQFLVCQIIKLSRKENEGDKNRFFGLRSKKGVYALILPYAPPTNNAHHILHIFSTRWLWFAPDLSAGHYQVVTDKSFTLGIFPQRKMVNYPVFNLKPSKKVMDLGSSNACVQVPYMQT